MSSPIESLPGMSSLAMNPMTNPNKAIQMISVKVIVSSCVFYTDDVGGYELPNERHRDEQ
jgi:hypothetical protein